MSSHLMNTYNRLPVAFTHGKGAWLYDEHGNAYLDALAGIAVNGLGHAHPRIVRALTEQAKRLAVTSRAYFNDRLPPFLERLCRLTGMDRVNYDTFRAPWQNQVDAFDRFKYGTHSWPEPYTISQLGGSYRATPDFLKGAQP